MDRQTEEHSLAMDISKLLSNLKLGDLLIKVADKEFKAHKLILSARSKVFQAMFEHDTKENRDNCVEITDVHPEVMREFLNFIYTDQSPNLRSFACQLITLADKYEVDKLKNLALNELIKHIHLENVLQALKLADLLSNEELMKTAIEFVISNIEEILEKAADEWNEIRKDDPELIRKIMINMSNEIKEKRREVEEMQLKKTETDSVKKPLLSHKQQQQRAKYYHQSVGMM